MDEEKILTLIGLLMALAIALGALRDARWWKRREREIRKPRAERRPTGFGGPWGD
jgi:hypothetical protein